MQPNQYAHLGQMPDSVLFSLGFIHDGQHWQLGTTKFYFILTPPVVAEVLREDGAVKYKQKLLDAINNLE